LWEYFAPQRNRRAELAADPGYVDKVLADGANRARAIAGQTMKRVRAAVGL
jgi:tryptophanyl-tRNA synthetase